MENFLPGFGEVKPVNAGRMGNLSDASRPWQATAGVGQQLTNIGDRGVQIAVKQKELEVKRKAAEMELEFAEMRDNYEESMLKSPNMSTEEAQKGWEKVSSQFMARYTSEGNSPMEEDILGLRARQLNQRAGSEITKSAMVSNIKRTEQAGMNMIEKGKANRDPEMIQNGFAILGSVRPEEFVETARMKIEKDMAIMGAEDFIVEDAFTARHMLYDDPERFRKEFPGVPAEDFNRLKFFADSQSKRTIGAAFDDFYNGVADKKVVDNDDIDTLFGNYPPKVVEDMKLYLAKRNQEAEKAFYESDEGQNKGMGRLSELLKTMPKTGGDDYYRMMGEAKHITSMLNDSPFEEYAKVKLSQITSQRKSRETDAVGLVGNKIEAMELPGGIFGTPVEAPGRMKVSQQINAGFIRNRTNLRRLGFSEDQAKEILGGEDETTTKPSEQLATFRRLWDVRDSKPAKDLAPARLAIAEAIKNGKTEVDYIDPKEVEAYKNYQVRTQGTKAVMLRAALEHFQLNPQATQDELMEAALSALDDPENSGLADEILGE